MNYCVYLLFFVLGLCFGSFVNMLVYRIAERYELENKKFKVKNKNRSYCDYCGNQLSWYENIPVFSWIIQKGRSRCCNKKLSILYPIVEIVVGGLFLLYSLRFMTYELNIISLILGLIIIVFLIFNTVFDIKYMILPDFSTVILIISALLIWIINYRNNWDYLYSALVSLIFFALLYFFTKGKGMGLGDVKLSIFMGLFLGWPKILLAIYIAFIVGALLGVIGICLGKISRKSQIPFGPFLVLGTLIAYFWGDQVLLFLIPNF